MTRPRPDDLAVVAAGAAAGALARWALSLGEEGSPFPWATLVVNLAGAFLLAVLPAVPLVRRSRRAALALGPGALGGFTTVSAWAGQVTGLAADGHEGLAALHLVTTLCGALVAAHLGRRLTRRATAPGALAGGGA